MSYNAAAMLYGLGLGQPSLALAIVDTRHAHIGVTLSDVSSCAMFSYHRATKHALA